MRVLQGRNTGNRLQKHSGSPKIHNKISKNQTEVLQRDVPETPEKTLARDQKRPLHGSDSVHAVKLARRTMQSKTVSIGYFFHVVQHETTYARTAKINLDIHPRSRMRVLSRSFWYSLCRGHN